MSAGWIRRAASWTLWTEWNCSEPTDVGCYRKDGTRSIRRESDQISLSNERRMSRREERNEPTDVGCYRKEGARSIPT